MFDGKFFCVLSMLIFFGCASSTKPAVGDVSNGKALDTAIEEAAVRIDDAFKAGTEIALVSVSSPSAPFSEYVLSYLETVLVNSGKLAVVDRANLDKVRAELGFQLSGEVSDESAKSIGKMLGAGAIVTGSLVDLGDVHRLNIKSINVETAKIAASYAGDIANSARVKTLLAAKGQSTSGTNQTVASVKNVTPATGSSAAKPAASIGIKVVAKRAGTLYFEGTETANLWADEEHTIPVSGPGVYTVTMQFANGKKTTRQVEINNRGFVTVAFDMEYKVGDTGPAGGIVFYDKTSYSDGWRYLEAAPASMEVKARWDTAVVMTKALVINDITGWRLPTQDELNWMYANLKKKGLGGFSNSHYWASEEGWGWAARALSFGNGEWAKTNGLIGDNEFIGKDNTILFRPIRQF